VGFGAGLVVSSVDGDEFAIVPDFFHLLNRHEHPKDLIHAHRGELRRFDAKIPSVGGPACWQS
jgi:hypothetical protein